MRRISAFRVRKRSAFHGGLTPPALVSQCARPPKKSDFCDARTHVCKSGGGQHAVAGSNKRLEPSVDRRCTWRVLHGVCAGNAANRVDTVHLQAAFIYKRRASARRDGMAGDREMVRPGSTDSGQVIRFSAAVLVHGKLGGCPTWSPDGRRGRSRAKLLDGWLGSCPTWSPDGRGGRRQTKISGGWPEGRLSVRHHGAVSADDIGGRMAGGRLSIRHMLSRLWATSLDKRSGATIRPFLQWDIGFGRHFWTDDLLAAAGGASRCGEELASDDSSRETHCAGSGVRGEEK